MGMKIIYTCDRCGKEKNTHKCALYTDRLRSQMAPFTGMNDNESPDKFKADLCDSCIESIVEEMRAALLMPN